jgi:hypothetical protein
VGSGGGTLVQREQFVFSCSQEASFFSDAARQRIMDMLGGIPVGRPGREVAELVAFLSSDRGAFVSGADYIVDGARSPRITPSYHRLGPRACGCFLVAAPAESPAIRTPIKVGAAPEYWLSVYQFVELWTFKRAFRRSEGATLFYPFLGKRKTTTCSSPSSRC